MNRDSGQSSSCLVTAENYIEFIRSNVGLSNGRDTRGGETRGVSAVERKFRGNRDADVELRVSGKVVGDLDHAGPAARVGVLGGS